MNKMIRVLRAFVLAAIVACVMVTPALAEDYTYTVRVYGGNKGTVNGQDPYVLGPFNYGDSCELDEGWVSVTDSKYYVKGFRLSGEDELHTEKFNVTEDMDFVVAYGVEGNMVQYTINFVDNATGAPLTSDLGRTSATFTGKVGDKPVVAAEFISGYRPLYNNITGTLKDGENSWTLPYVAIEAGEGTETVTTNTTYYDNPVTVAGGAAAGGAAAGGAAAGGAAAGGAAAEGGEAAAPAAPEAPAAPAAPETQEILDVDNPLAAPDTEGTGSEGSGTEGTGSDTENIGDEGTPADSGLAAITSNPGMMAGVAVGIAAVAALLYAMLRKKKDDAAK